MLIKLGADSNIKDDLKTIDRPQGRTAKQYAQTNLLRAIQDFSSIGYDYFEEGFNNCGACVAKKEEKGYDYWDEIVEENFLECFNECSDAPCYRNF